MKTNHHFRFPTNAVVPNFSLFAVFVVKYFAIDLILIISL
jgi:hypothetical protein